MKNNEHKRLIIFHNNNKTEMFLYFNALFLTWICFFIHQGKNGGKWGKKLGFFWCGIMNIHDNKLVHDA
jgi:hypothetical protein